MLKNCIGEDIYGHRLYPGDICSYTVTYPENNITNKYKGMIIYDDYKYAFAFEQLEEDFPMVMMSEVNINTIKKIVEADGMDSSYPDYCEWMEIFNNHK